MPFSVIEQTPLNRAGLVWYGDITAVDGNDGYACDQCLDAIANLSDVTEGLVEYVVDPLPGHIHWQVVYYHCLPTGRLLRCDLCSHHTYRQHTITTDDGYDLCARCVRRSDVHSCGDCDVYYVDDHECQVDEDEDADDNRIHPYHYTPNPVFHGTNVLQFGIELEMDLTDNRTYIECLENMGDEDKYQQDFYFKHDGSLNRYGVELVTHPRDLDAWRLYADQFGAMLQSTSAAGGRAWTRDECGLHIHVSRAGFDSLAHVARFALFFARNQAPWTTLANRQSSYATWSRLGNGEVMTKVKYPEYGNHYDAVSLAPQRTIEVRIFRPSLAIGRVIGSIELVAAAVEYTRRRATNLTDFFTWGNFRNFVTDDNYKYAAHIMRGGKFTPERKANWSIKEGN